MEQIIRKILLENIDKGNLVIVNSIMKKMRIEFYNSFYHSIAEIVEDFKEEMGSYVSENWEKYFTMHNDNDDDDPPIFTKTDDLYGAEYDWDEMELEMFYMYVDEMIKEGYIRKANEDYYHITKNIVYFYYDKFKIAFRLNSKYVKGKLNVQVVDGNKYWIVISNILNEFGIDSKEDILKIEPLLFEGIVKKISSMNITEKDRMLKGG